MKCDPVYNAVMRMALERAPRRIREIEHRLSIVQMTLRRESMVYGD